jgi:hypothetical protein
MKAYEVIAICEALLKVIFESLSFMPQSVRYLLKTIEISYLKYVTVKIIHRNQRSKRK